MIASLFVAAGVAAADPQGAGASDLGQVLQDLETGNRRQACRAGTPDELVVCGRRSDRYRIDRRVLQASRAANPNGAKASPSAQAMAEARYGNPQDRGRVAPTDVRQMPAGKAVIAAVTGGDWRDGFKGPPSEYELLEAAKSTPAR